MFVLVHSLLTREELKEEEYPEAMKFMLGFVEFAVKYARRIIKLLPEYFESLGSNKFTYLLNDKVAYVSAFNEVLILLNHILRAESTKHISIFKNKQINQDTLVNFFVDLKV
jgi:hypothetical protein